MIVLLIDIITNKVKKNSFSLLNSKNSNFLKSIFVCVLKLS